MSKLIPISGGRGAGKFAVVDDDDYERLAKYKWYLGAKGHPSRTAYIGGKRTIYMHVEIMGRPDGFQVDHKNRNPLDNRKENLRICTHSENMKNRSMQKNKSGYKGVSPRKKKWLSVIYVNRKKVVIGWFYDKIEAAKAYDKAARQYYGEFAATNFED